MNINFNKTALVVAHSTDEIFFFGSVVDKVEHIYVCYNSTPKNYFLNSKKDQAKKFLTSIKPNITYLNLTEPQILGTGNFDSCEQNIFGLTNNVPFETMKVHFEKVASKLIESGINKYDTIISHNMWGENGHEENILIQRVVSALQKQFKFKYITNSFFSSTSEKLMRECIDNYSFLCNIDVNQNLCEFLKQTYIFYKTGLQQWPWLLNYKWYTQEKLLITNNTPDILTKLY